MRPGIANALWIASCRPAWRNFQKAAGRVQEMQESLLSNYLKKNRQTEYGERHHFAAISSPSQYQENVPLSTYEHYAGYIDRMGAGEKSVLTHEPVGMFELSSGSTMASKLVPYTRGLKSEFQRGISPWIHNLYTTHPHLQGGPSYWSITPLTNGKRHTAAGIPIGFESDTEYLGFLGQWLLGSVMAVPDTVKNISNVETFRYVTLLYLLSRPDLRLISVWNPTFLSLLIASLPEWWESLLNDIERGRIRRDNLDIRFAPRPGQARALRVVSPFDYESIWPHLQLISCWMDGASEPHARRLKDLFPHVEFQAKGLLATEAFVSLPICGQEGGVLAVNSHFFEFIDDAKDVFPAHQIEKGKRYSVVVTTGGGFYRYQLHDVVEVIGHWGQAPRIRFIGKADHISDWFGEKLDERFVAGILEKVFAKHQISPVFAMLAPDEDAGFRYILHLEGDARADPLAEDLDQALRENFHYDYCRKLGQLEAVQINRITHGTELYVQACQSRGQKLGNIKPSVLQKNTGWKEWFETKMELTS